MERGEQQRINDNENAVLSIQAAQEHRKDFGNVGGRVNCVVIH